MLKVLRRLVLFFYDLGPSPNYIQGSITCSIVTKLQERLKNASKKEEVRKILTLEKLTALLNAARSLLNGKYMKPS